MADIQWILGVEKATAFFGCVGKDDAAATLKKCAEADSVDARYLGGNCIMGSPRHLVVRSNWGHLTTWWGDFFFIQLSLLAGMGKILSKSILRYRYYSIVHFF